MLYLDWIVWPNHYYHGQSQYKFHQIFAVIKVECFGLPSQKCSNKFKRLFVMTKLSSNRVLSQSVAPFSKEEKILLHSVSFIVCCKVQKIFAQFIHFVVTCLVQYSPISFPSLHAHTAFQRIHSYQHCHNRCTWYSYLPHNIFQFWLLFKTHSRHDQYNPQIQNANASDHSNALQT